MINALGTLEEMLDDIRYIQREVEDKEWAGDMSDMGRGYNKASKWVSDQAEMHRECCQKKKDGKKKE
jgi:hypothetical protein